MVNNKSPSRNREDFKRWYYQQDASGIFYNKIKYLKKRLISRILKGEQIQLKTLRKYGLLKFYKKQTNRKNRRKLQDDLEIEPAIAAKPDPYIFPDGTVSLESMGKYTKPVSNLEAASPLDLPPNVGDDPAVDSEDFMPLSYVPENVVIRPKKQRGRKPLPKSNTNQIVIDDENLPKDKRKRAAVLRKQIENIPRQYKSRKRKFTFQDALDTLRDPNLRSINTGEIYAPGTKKTMISVLRNLVKIMKCEKNQNLVSCFKNARSVKQALLTSPNPRNNKPPYLPSGKKGVGYKGWKEFVKIIVVLANSNKDFAALLGVRALKNYRKLQQEGITESNEEQDKKVEEDVVIDWKKYLQVYDRELINFNNLYKKWQETKEINNKEKNFITNFLLLAFPILTEPKRDVYGNLKVKDKRDDEVKNNKNQNYYIRSSRLVLLRQYKTVKKYGEQEYLLKGRNSYKGKDGKKMGEIIEKSLKMWNRNFLITKVNGKQYADGRNSSRLHKAMEEFGLKEENPRKNSKGEPEQLGFNDYRHSRVVYAVEQNATNKERRQLALDMLHSKEMSEKYMRLLGDNILKDVEK